MHSLPATTIAMRKLEFRRKRKYHRDDYRSLLQPYLGAYESLRLCDYVAEPSLDGRRILIIRHDVDHDPFTAVKIARWEKENGLRATYCILHTAWYYGRLEAGRYARTRDIVEIAQEIVDLGHEINFHNNLVALALRERLDPVAILREELAFWRSRGIDITGSSTHGDALCRELNFRNWELFKECCDDRFGGPRTVTYRAGGGEACSIELGRHSMFDFGLKYEAYDIGRDVYHTDSGGRLRVRENTRGRRSFGRTDRSSHVVGVLTHPEWWDFP